MPDTKPGVVLDNNGRCNGCRSYDMKKNIDWTSRWQELENIVKKIKKRKSSTYDCLVPVSGGKDSWYQAYTLSKRLGLKVLCVVMGAHLPTKEGIHNLNTMISDLNVDILKITLKPSVLKKLRTKMFYKQLEPAWAEHSYVFSGVANTALLYDIPLICWGEDIAFEFGGSQKESTSDALYIDNSDLLKDKSVELDDISHRDIFFYKYPEHKRLKQAGISSIYLGYYVWWDGRKNYNFAKKRGFIDREKGSLSGNYINYDNIDEKLCEIHIWFKYIKFGFWRSTDQTCYDIWNGRMDRSEAVKIIKELQDQFPQEYFEDF